MVFSIKKKFEDTKPVIRIHEINGHIIQWPKDDGRKYKE
jgi:hypothetical protein